MSRIAVEYSRGSCQGQSQSRKVLVRIMDTLRLTQPMSDARHNDLVGWWHKADSAYTLDTACACPLGLATQQASHLSVMLARPFDALQPTSPMQQQCISLMCPFGTSCMMIVTTITTLHMAPIQAMLPQLWHLPLAAVANVDANNCCILHRDL